jgi:drug/metabolite transporter (DMT)-like permease
VMTAATFAVGHLLNVLSLRVGDVSLATPLLGAKVIFVGLIGWSVFGIRLDHGQWIAATLATFGVVVIGFTDFHAGRGMGIATLLSLGCAATFALTDTMIQSWGATFGTLNFLGLQFVALGLISLGMLPFLGGVHGLKASSTAWRWILTAAGLSGLQAILITATISLWRDAAGVNVIYATRGLWSLAFVWFAGHWTDNTERHQVGPRAMLLRATGAALLLAAVVVTAWSTATRK